MRYFGSSRTLSILWTVLLFLLPACSDHYGSIGPPTLNREGVAGEEMSLLAGIPGGPGTADGTGENARFNLPDGIAEFGGFLYIADRSNHIIRLMDLGTRQVATLAGSPGRAGTSNGRGKDARFNSPEGVAVSEDGKTLYVADTGNHAIRKINLETLDVTTLAGRRGQAGTLDSSNGRGDSATFRGPGGLVYTGTGLYVADSDNHTLRRVNLTTGETLTLAGKAGTSGNQDGIGGDALFNFPLGIAADGNILYVADTGNHTLRRIDLMTCDVAGRNCSVTTVAGIGASGATDGPALEAGFSNPAGVTVGGGRVYIADRGNALIREYLPEIQEVRTVAGTAGVTGSEDSMEGNPRFNFLSGLAVRGNLLYVADTGNHVIREVNLQTGWVQTLSGQTSHQGVTDGPSGVGRFWSPWGIVFDRGLFYVTDAGAHTIRQVDPSTGEITTLVGSPGNSGTTDSHISPAYFNFYFLGKKDDEDVDMWAGDIAVSEDETELFIVDTGNHAIRRLFLSTGQVETFVGIRGSEGSADGGFGIARFKLPQGVVRIGDFLYLVDTGNHVIRRIEIPAREVTTLAGHPGEAGQSDGVGQAAFFNGPQDITTDGTFLYVADTLNHAIRKVDPRTGEVTTVAGVQGQSGFLDSADEDPGGPKLNAPGGVLYHNGFLYISDTGNYVVRQVNLATGEVSLLAGDKSCNEESATENGVPVVRLKCTGNPTGLSNYLDSTDGTGKTASFLSPAGLAADGNDLYLMDSGNHSLRRIDISGGDGATGATFTVAGGQGYSDGVGRGSRFKTPVGVSLAGHHLYFSDCGNSLVRWADLADRENPMVATLAGNVGLRGRENSGGYEARFNSPIGITADGAGNLYVTDTGSHTIRKVEIDTRKVTTLAGVPGSKGYVNTAFGIPLFNGPRGLIWDADHLYVADTENHLIRRINLTSGRVSLVAGHGDERTLTGSSGTEDSTGQAAGFNAPQGITADETYLYVTDTGNHTIRRILKVTGEVRTIGGMPRESGAVDDVGFAARFNAPRGIVNDGGYLYIADSRNNLIRRLEKQTRKVVTLSGVVQQSSFAPGFREDIRHGLISGLTTTPDSPYLFIVDTTENAVGRLTK